MFDLEQSIAEWRRQMLADGVRAPVPLDELESHLRDDVENQMRAGLEAQQAFETSVRQIGQTGALRTEFAKARGTVYEQMKQWFGAVARIPNYQLAMNIDTSQQAIEPRWATYCKTIAFILPAIILWVGALVLVLPKLKEICVASQTALPKPIVTALDVSDLFKSNFFIAAIAIVSALVLLEGRSRWWARRRRLVLGVVAFLLNSGILIIISAMLVLAVVAASNLLHYAK